MNHDPLAWIEQSLDQLVSDNVLRTASTRQGLQAVRCQWNDRQYLNFGSNDYLGLASDPRLVDLVAPCLASYGWGSGASPLVTGRSAAHADLELALADFEQTEAALVFATGYAANAGTIPALVGRGDCVFSDAKNHASIIDGCRLSGAKIVVYEHANVDDLRRRISAVAAGRRKLIVTDGLFSMDGDFAPLAAIAQIAEEHGVMLLVDEAHATGVIGQHGRGVCEYFGVETATSVRVGTLSKALGSHGGFVVGQRRVIEWLRNRARPYVFSTAAPAAVAQIGRRALQIVAEEPARREDLLRRAADVRDRLRRQGWSIGQSCSQIIPVICGDARTTMRASQRLREEGIWVPGIRPPSVPDGESLLRLSLSYLHTETMLAQLLQAFEALKHELDL